MSGFIGNVPQNVRRFSRKNKRLNKKAIQVATASENPFIPKNISDKPSQKKSKPRQKQVTFPSKIDVSEFNICYIDSKIREKLSFSMNNISELENELDILIRIANNDKDPYQKVLAVQKQDILRKKIRDIQSGMELVYYIFRTTKLIDEFREIEGKTTCSFIGKNHEKSKPYILQTENRKNHIIREYLAIAGDYLDLENLRNKTEKMICECGSTDFSIASDNDYLYICNNCAGEIEYLDDNPSFKDSDRVNMSSKYRYSRKGHFVEATKKFQGTQNVDPKKINRVVKILLEEMRLNNLVAERGLPNSVTKDNLDTFLSSCRLSNHYDDLNLLYHIITGEPCPDISMYMDMLLVDIDQLERVLIEIQDENRTNSLNVYFKLYKLLQRYGAPYKKDDFYILKTQVKEHEHDLKMREAFEILGWEWQPT